MTVAHDPPGTAYALMSYHYFKRLDFDVWARKHGFAAGNPRIFGDSGAFSARSLGVPIVLNEYAAWCKRWAHVFDCYANLDVIGDWRASLENQKRLEGFGLTPVPVIHSNAPLALLETQYRDYKYIALGMLTKQNRPAIKRLLIEVHRRRPDAAFHAFGITGVETISDLPLYSADSSNVTSSVRFKMLTLWNPVTHRLNHVSASSNRLMWKNRKLLDAHGVTLTAMMRDDARYWDWLIPTTLSYYKFMRYCRARHGVIAHPTEARAGLRLYLANTNSEQVAAMVRAVEAVRA